MNHQGGAFTLIELPKAVSKGFTLIELLVVITIIVVLLALLTPALDKAIYQAQLATCGARLDSLATGSITYATANRRQYPYRRGARDLAGWWTNQLAQANSPSYDDRRILGSFLDLNAHLVCPLTAGVDLEGSLASSHTFSTYDLWFGYRYTGEQGMLRLGDRFTWTDPADGARHSFRLLAGDYAVGHLTSRWALATHPDKDGRMVNAVNQDEQYPGQPTSSDYTFSWWANGNERGPVDLQFAFDDGSIVRFDDVIYWQDPRLVMVPQFSNNREPNRMGQVPAN